MPETFATHGLVLTEHEFEVPLDHARPDGERITVFAREVADPDGLDRPYLVFFQGGPGFEAPRPTRHPSSPGMAGPRAAGLPRAHARPARDGALDARSARCRAATPAGAGRVADATSAPTRSSATPSGSARELGVERWSVLGQSFGGLCVTSYLSLAPEGLREALITGGLPPLGHRIDDVYRATYARIARALPALLRRATPPTARASARCTSAWRPRTSACPPATG